MDSLYLKAGIHGIATSITVADVRTNPSYVAAAGGRPPIAVEKPSTSAAAAAPQRMAPRGFSFKHPLRSLWPGRRDRFNAVSADDAVLHEEKKEGGEIRDNGESEGWILKILQVRSPRKNEGDGPDKKSGDKDDEMKNDFVNAVDQTSECSKTDDVSCDFCTVTDEEDDEIQFDRASFSKLLRRVSMAEAKLYAQMSYLGYLAYSIPQIKPANLLKRQGFRFVTSSLEKKEQVSKSETEKTETEIQESESNSMESVEEDNETMISASAAYHIAASAASYLYSHTENQINSSKSAIEIDEETADSLTAATESMTSGVAAEEEVKQAVADGLNSIRSSPCEWFICDDDQSRTRFFVIQGSETVASWQANLLFEPVQFEGLDVLVHRGIYEAAKGIYEQMLPEVRSHLDYHGDRAAFRFTGHSLGGSLSLLVNLMLFIRGEVGISSLLPVITFGSPSIMCGGDRLLRNLGLPWNHVRSIAMHRDIVPRVFSCNYPNHVAEILKAINVNFRHHPCLNDQRLLYAPFGEFLILQPDDNFSPNHHLLPPGSGLYLLAEANDSNNQIRAAQALFLNSPHPLEILSDRSAYGSKGTIHRDHDMTSYLKSIRAVIRQELNRRARQRVWRAPSSPRKKPVSNTSQVQFKFHGIVESGRESLERFSRHVASQHTHLLVVFFFPLFVSS